MVSLDYLKEMMERDLAVMDDPTQPAEIRRVARNRFWHCEKRAGAMERSGRTEGDPGHFLIGYGEIDTVRHGGSKDKEMRFPKDAQMDARREYLDRKSEVQIAARETL